MQSTDSGAFVSYTSSTTGSQTDVGLKAEYKTPTFFGFSFTITARAATTVQKEEKKK